MAAIHGRKGRLYAGVASDTATAEPIANLTNWTLDAATDKADVTAFGANNKSYVSGIPDAQGTFTGFYDTASAQLYTAATDGLARKMYLYPTNASEGTYWFGTALFDFSINTAVDGAVAISGSWAAATAVSKVG
jgi:hypothetical protein